MTVRERALLIAVAGSAGIAVFAGGGFDPAPQLLFASVAGLALLLAVSWRPEEAVAAARQPPLRALAGLAVITVAGAAWTVGDAADGLRWGLVIAGYVALAIAAATLVGSRARLRALAGIVCGIAAACGCFGLVAAALQETPAAERIAGSWQPGGSFEYAPALALLQVTALPMLLSAMCRPGRRLPAAAAIGASIAGAQLALSDSVVAQSLGAAVLAAAVIAPGRTLRSERWVAVAACLVVVAAGLGAHAAIGGYARPIVNPGDGVRLAELAAAVLIPSALWLLGRDRLGSALGRIGPRRRGWAAATGAAALVIVVLGTLALADDAGRFKVRGVSGEAGSGAGRGELWGDAIDAALDRPVAGHGSESFRVATAEEQGFPAVRYAHNHALQSWVELGLAGLALCLLLYGGAAVAIWRSRELEAAWLFGPGVAAFLIANLVDWPWHLAGSGAIWALCLGGLIGAIGSGDAQSDIRQAQDD